VRDASEESAISLALPACSLYSTMLLPALRWRKRLRPSQSLREARGRQRRLHWLLTDVTRICLICLCAYRDQHAARLRAAREEEDRKLAEQLAREGTPVKSKPTAK
jgi:hypothetical protein